MTIQIHVLGVPAPQGSKTAIARGGRAFVIEGGSTVGRVKHRAWRDAVTAATLEQVPHQLRFHQDDALEVEIDFVMPRPKSRPHDRLCKVKPDLDKLIRSTLDGLADGHVFKHDSRVSSLICSKQYEVPGQRPGAYVTIRRDSLEGGA